MKKTIVQRIKEKIKGFETDFADAHIAKGGQLLQETPDKSEIAKAELRMEFCEKQITWLKKLLKSESSE